MATAESVDVEMVDTDRDRPCAKRMFYEAFDEDDEADEDALRGRRFVQLTRSIEPPRPYGGYSGDEMIMQLMDAINVQLAASNDAFLASTGGVVPHENYLQNVVVTPRIRFTSYKNDADAFIRFFLETSFYTTMQAFPNAAQRECRVYIGNAQYARPHERPDTDQVRRTCYRKLSRDPLTIEIMWKVYVDKPFTMEDVVAELDNSAPRIGTCYVDIDTGCVVTVPC